MDILPIHSKNHKNHGSVEITVVIFLPFKKKERKDMVVVLTGSPGYRHSPAPFACLDRIHIIMSFHVDNSFYAVSIHDPYGCTKKETCTSIP